MSDEYLTVEQLAERLQVRADTVRRWLRTGQLRGVRLGRDWRVTAEDLAAFLAERRNASG